MATIEEFIRNNLGKPNVTPKFLLMEAYAMGVAHGKGEEYEEVEEAEIEEEEEKAEEEQEE